MSEQRPKEIKIDFPTEVRKGSYCNNMIVSHTREEFILDFMMVSQPAGTVVARVIMSPGHLKRTISALQDNLGKYEKRFGKVEEAVEPTKEQMGFHLQ